jgi:hypothetical protein
MATWRGVLAGADAAGIAEADMGKIKKKKKPIGLARHGTSWRPP